MQLWVKMLYSCVRHENMTAITEAVLKLVGLLSVNEAGHLRELRERRSGRERKREREEEKTQLRSSQNKTKQNDNFSPGSDFHPGPLLTSAPTSCRIISWITTSASVLKSWTNFLFLSSPVFSCTSSWKRGASCLQTLATLAAFSATRSSSRSRSAMPERENSEVSECGDGKCACVRV